MAETLVEVAWIGVMVGAITLGLIGVFDFNLFVDGLGVKDGSDTLTAIYGAFGLAGAADLLYKLDQNGITLIGDS